MAKLFSSLLAIASCVLAAGCGTTLGDRLGWDLEPRYKELSETQPDDLAVPAGFRMVRDTKESFSIDLAADGFRRAHLVYVGRSSPRAVARFYGKTMVLPTYGWENRTENRGEGDRTLKFVKGRTVCTVVITETSVRDVKRTRLEVDLVTRSS